MIRSRNIIGRRGYSQTNNRNTEKNRKRKLEDVVADLNPPSPENVIVNRSSLIQFVRRHSCRRCRGNNLTIVEGSLGLTTTLNTFCEICDNTRNNLNHSSITGYIADLDDESYQYYKHRDEIEKTSIRPFLNEKMYGKDDNDSSKELDVRRLKSGKVGWDSLTTKTVIGVLATGMSGSDVEELFAHMDIEHGFDFDRMFKKVSPMVGDHIEIIRDEILEENLHAEIEATIRLMMKGRDERLIQRQIELWKSLSPERMVVALRIAYDMGWQKRSSGKNSVLCNHQFMKQLCTN